MSLFIFNSSEQLQLVINETAAAADKGLMYYDNPIHTEDTQGLNIFEFETPSDHPDSQYIKENYFVGFKDLDGNFQLFEIKEIKEIHSSGKLIKKCYCEHDYYSLIDEVIEDVRPSNCSAAFALGQALSGSNWAAGTVDNLGTNSTNFYYESRKSAISKIINKWGGAIRPRITLAGTTITGRYIDLLARRGADTGKIFEYTKDLKDIERYVNSKNLITAAYGRGKGVLVGEVGGGETYGRRLTIAGAEWRIEWGDPADKPIDQEYIEDPAALALYGRNGRHRIGVFKDEEEIDDFNLLTKTWDYIQANNKPKVTYTMKVTDLERLTGYKHEAVRLGDGIRAIDKEFSPALYLNASIVKIERNLLDPTDTVITLGNFIDTIAGSNTDLAAAVDDYRDRQGVYDTLGAGHVPTAWLEGQINALQNMINAGGGTVTVTENDGILITNTAASPTNALRLIGGALSIANSTLPGGGWNWRSFGTGDGFTADVITTGALVGGKIKFDLTNGLLTVKDQTNAFNMVEFKPDKITFGKTAGQQLIVNADGSITTPNITADKIQGGILTLGGASNGNGVFKLLNSSGALTGLFQNDGIRLLEGQLVIQANYSGTNNTTSSTSAVLYSNKLQYNQADPNGSANTYYGVGGWSISNFYTGMGGAASFLNDGANVWTLTAGNRLNLANTTLVSAYAASAAKLVLNWPGANYMGIGNAGGQSLKIGVTDINGAFLSGDFGVYMPAAILTGADACLKLEANGARGVELRSYDGGASYIDFSRNSSEDYSMRILHSGPGGDLAIQGGSFHVYGAFYSNSKSALTETPDYGQVITYCDESPNHVFNDRGYGELDETGTAYIYMDPIYLQTVNTSGCDYWLQLTAFEGTDAKIRELQEEYFIVAGTPGGRFMWRVEAERFGYEKLRFNEADILI